MAIQARSKIVREAIEDENGNKLGEIAFNPDDLGVHKKFINVINVISGKSKEIAAIEPDIDLSALETAEQLEAAGEAFESVGKALTLTIDTFDFVTRELDSIFGEGTCALFTGGSYDDELLLPLINGVMPHFKKARQAAVKKYKAGAQGGALK